MIENYSKNITADGLTGMIFAMEGIRDGIVLLNGPTGCRFYHSVLSEDLIRKPTLYETLENGEKISVDESYLNNWFFRQQHVPCTYLDGYDYVYGTGEKVREALIYLRDRFQFGTIAVVNSPGAALIGDQIRNIIDEELPGRHVIYLESPGYSKSFEYGYSKAFVEYFRQTCGCRGEGLEMKFSGVTCSKKDIESFGEACWGEGEKTVSMFPDMTCGEGEKTVRESSGGKVNLLGISIWNRYWEGDVEEISRLLNLCGISVGVVPFTGCGEEELVHIGDASLNVVLNPAMALEGARLLEQIYGTPCYVMDGPPIGFDATDRMIRDICHLLGKDSASYEVEAEKARALAWKNINRVYKYYGLPEGVGFYVDAGESLNKVYSDFLEHYLGMIPTSWEKAELVFSNANTISARMVKNQAFCGIEVANPGLGYIDVIPKTQMGIKGALFLVEQVLNGLMSRL